jgi:hypothetical protein
MFHNFELTQNREGKKKPTKQEMALTDIYVSDLKKNTN